MNAVIKKSDPAFRRGQKSAKNRPALLRISRKGLRISALSAGLGILLAVGNFLLVDVGSDWYEQLAKPGFCPPLAALFGTYLAAVAAFCTGFGFVAAGEGQGILVFEYLQNAALQMLWTLFFFRLRAVFFALAAVCLLALHTVFLARATYRARGRIAWVLLLHVLRVAFCILLNYAILVLN